MKHKPIIKCTKDHILVLCKHGKLIDSYRSKEWARSIAEATLTNPDYKVDCSCEKVIGGRDVG